MTPPSPAQPPPGRSSRSVGGRARPRTARDRALRAVAWGATAVGAALAVGALVLARDVRVRARVVRAAFDKGGRETEDVLAAFAPDDGVVTVQRGLRYRPGDPDAFLDVYRPAGGDGEALPTVVWVHGGGWLAGRRSGIAAWASILAAEGLTVVVPDYTLAPRRPYPYQLQQVLDAVAHLRERPPAGVDPSRLFVAGDSAGASLGAQAATVLTSPAYRDEVGVSTQLPSDTLSGLVLCCGPYDLAVVSAGGRGLLAWASTTIGWSYLGTATFLDDPRTPTLSLVDHVYPGLPPVYLTGGNGDALTAGARLYAERLAAAGTTVETLFFEDDHTERGARLGHEYQFDLRLEAARTSLARSVAFVRRNA